MSVFNQLFLFLWFGYNKNISSWLNCNNKFFFYFQKFVSTLFYYHFESNGTVQQLQRWFLWSIRTFLFSPNNLIKVCLSSSMICWFQLIDLNFYSPKLFTTIPYLSSPIHASFICTAFGWHQEMFSTVLSVNSWAIILSRIELWYLYKNKI